MARAYRAEFEWYAHAPIAVDLGVPETVVEAIRRGVSPSSRTRSSAPSSTSRASCSTRAISTTCRNGVTEALTAGQLVELTTLVGYYATLAMQMRLFRVPLPREPSPPFPRTDCPTYHRVVRFGLLQEGLCDAGTDGHRRYHEMVDEAVIAEESGFDFYANSEQHFIVTEHLVSTSSPEVC